MIGDSHTENEGKGIFTYFLDENKEKEKVSELLAKSLGAETYKCYANITLSQPISSSIDDYKMPSVERWLGSFARADFVVTDSFHGMVFSIIFEKPFIVISNKERGSARFYSLLSKINSTGFLVDDYEDVVKNISRCCDIKPIKIRDLIFFRNKSISFLEDCL